MGWLLVQECLFSAVSAHSLSSAAAWGPARSVPVPLPGLCLILYLLTLEDSMSQTGLTLAN